jgi:hypothetical protein
MPAAEAMVGGTPNREQHERRQMVRGREMFSCPGDGYVERVRRPLDLNRA